MIHRIGQKQEYAEYASRIENFYTEGYFFRKSKLRFNQGGKAYLFRRRYGLKSCFVL